MGYPDYGESKWRERKLPRGSVVYVFERLHVGWTLQEQLGRD
jgi:hypothetical protein